MKEYNFENGVIVGRFEPLHIGHQKLIEIALSNCKTVLVFITTNITKDKNNPFDFSYKSYLFKKIYSYEIKNERIILENFVNNIEFNHTYGKALLEKSNNILNDKINCIIYGSDKDISKCFCKSDINDLSQIKINRNIIKTSSTLVRKLLLKKDINRLKEVLDVKLYGEIDKMINIVCKYY